MCSAIVTLIVYPTPGQLKNQPDHGGNRTRDLWFASPMLYQLSYEVNLEVDLVAQLVEHWTSKPKVAGSIPTVVRLIFQLAWCGIYTQSNNITTQLTDKSVFLDELCYADDVSEAFDTP